MTERLFLLGKESGESVKCILDLAGQCKRLQLQFLLKFVNEIDFPLQAFQLPRPECESKKRNNPNYNHRWGDP